MKPNEVPIPTPPDAAPSLRADMKNTLDLDAGIALDVAVHAAIGGEGKALRYSTSMVAAMKIFDAFPQLWLVKSEPTTPDLWFASTGEPAPTGFFTFQKPWLAGVPDTLVIACATPMLALSKCAILLKARESAGNGA